MNIEEEVHNIDPVIYSEMVGTQLKTFPNLAARSSDVWSRVTSKNGQISISTCLLTIYFARLEKSDFPDADAILFHERNFDRTDLPRQEDRRPEQLYVHYTLESPFWSQEGKDNNVLCTVDLPILFLFLFVWFYSLSVKCSPIFAIRM